MPVKKIGKDKSVSLILAAVLILAFFFRFYRLVDWFPFGMDTEYETFLVRNIVTFKHWPLIGVNASDTGIYLGPLFIYLSVIPYLLFLGNPLGFAVTASLLGVVTTYLIFIVVRKLFSVPAGLFSAFFYAVSFLAAFYDRNYWNPSLVPLLSLLIGYFIYRLNSKHYQSLIFLSLAFGLAFHTHLSLLVFTPLIIWVIFKNYKYIPGKIKILSLILFFVLQAPLVIFEFRHNFPNTGAVVELFKNMAGRKNVTQSVAEKSLILTNFLGRYIWVPPAPDLFVEKGICRELAAYRKNAYPEIIGLVFLGLIYFIYGNKIHHHPHKKEGSASKIIISTFILALLSVFLYNRNIYEFYFLFLTPYLAVILGVSASILWHKAHGREIVYLILIVYFFMNLITLSTAASSYSHRNKLAVIDFTKNYVKSGNYSLEALGDCPRFAGWRYLFEYYAGTPLHSYMDSYFDWLYAENINGSPPDNIVLLSLIDSRSDKSSMERWQEEKINFLTGFNIQAQKLIENIQVYILAPKK